MAEALAEEGGEKNQEEVKLEINNDLKRLIKEAESGSDERSRRIVNLMDVRIRDWLKQIAAEDEKQYLFRYSVQE